MNLKQYLIIAISLLCVAAIQAQVTEKYMAKKLVLTTLFSFK
ncbi:hypothetical protein [Aquimarina sp. AU58]|nr:hypothetical protein [Aquimarina sp. AU58]